MTIIDSLKAKGSTGGNNIAEAIKNLPDGGEFVIHVSEDFDAESGYAADKTYNEIKEAIKAGRIPVAYMSKEVEDGICDIRRYNFSKIDEYSGTMPGIFFSHMFGGWNGVNKYIGVCVNIHIKSDNSVVVTSSVFDAEED